MIRERIGIGVQSHLSQSEQSRDRIAFKMILRSICPRYFGPFIGESTLTLEPEVTVVTGPNDVGKSLVLRAIELLCTDACAEDYEIYRKRPGEFAGKWTDDPELVCEAQFEISPQSKGTKGLPADWPEGTLMKVRKRLNVRTRTAQITEAKTKSGTVTNPCELKRFPQILTLPLLSEIRPTINLSEMTEAELHFVRLAMGGQFGIEQHTALSQIDRSFRLHEGEEELNERIKRILPPSMPMRFKLVEIGGQPESLGVGLIDGQREFTPLNCRGTGVRRLLNLMGAILRLDPNAGHAIVLFDEPETSLHADSQHMLRRLLEGLAAHPNIQVVYTTHSPAMINTLRPKSLRVIERSQNKTEAKSVFINDAYSANFSKVRTSLGISPADSLLFAPITIIVEGVTEVRCLPAILNKLVEAGEFSLERLELLLAQTHLLDGEGSSFEYMCRLAKSQNVCPIIFLDGDKTSEVPALKLKHPDVSVICLDTGTEFEQVVPVQNYLKAAAKILDDEEITEANFRSWEHGAKLGPKVMFSKRVERWLIDVKGMSVSKPRLMADAVETTDAKELTLRPFRELLLAMTSVAESL